MLNKTQLGTKCEKPPPLVCQSNSGTYCVIIPDQFCGIAPPLKWKVSLSLHRAFIQRQEITQVCNYISQHHKRMILEWQMLNNVTHP